MGYRQASEEGVYLTRHGKINFVDLAGSEMTKKTNSHGKTLEEANNINKSLMVLGKPRPFTWTWPDNDISIHQRPFTSIVTPLTLKSKLQFRLLYISAERSSQTKWPHSLSRFEINSTAV